MNDEQHTTQPQEPDGYYMDDMGNDEEVDMSFLDDETTK